MKKFKYKFETIARLKETLEKQAQKEVAEIDLEIDKWKIQLQNLMDEAQKARKDFPLKKTTVSEVKFAKNHQLILKKRIEETNKKISVLNEKRKVKMKELVERTKEKKIFESLREKHLEKYIKEQDKLELSQIDEFATQKFVRSER